MKQQPFTIDQLNLNPENLLVVKPQGTEMKTAKVFNLPKETLEKAQEMIEKQLKGFVEAYGSKTAEEFTRKIRPYIDYFTTPMGFVLSVVPKDYVFESIQELLAIINTLTTTFVIIQQQLYGPQGQAKIIIIDKLQKEIVNAYKTTNQA